MFNIMYPKTNFRYTYVMLEVYLNQKFTLKKVPLTVTGVDQKNYPFGTRYFTKKMRSNYTYMIFRSIFLILFNLLILNGSAQTQLGADILGEASNDFSGWSVSMPDSKTIGIGAYLNNGTVGSQAGQARVFRWSGSAWVQKGSDIDGESPGDNSGFSISMPDSNTIAIGAPKNAGNSGNRVGHTRIYRWNGSAWVQKGADIDGEANLDESGTCISMPDSNTVAIGAPKNDGNGTNSGRVRLYQYDIRWNNMDPIRRGH